MKSVVLLMENNILSNKELFNIVNNHPDNYTQILKSKNHPEIYNTTYNYITSNYIGNSFSEKLYKHIYGEQYCKECYKTLPSSSFRSFFGGYKKELCSRKCMYKNKDRINHIKHTKLLKYGSSSYNNQEKYKQTMLKKYGVIHNWSKNSPIRENCFATNEKLHGNRFWNNTEKRKKTNLKKYGVEYPCQNNKILNKSQRYKLKIYTLPSGKQIKIQGYEPFALNLLLKSYSENDIITSKSKMPKIIWNDGISTHRYYPDIYIPKENRFIEVKSKWTWKIQESLNFQKINAVNQSGYNIDILIFNRKGELL